MISKENHDSALKKKLFVIKRNGDHEEMLYDKIRERIQVMIDIEPKLSDELDPGLIVKKVISGIFSGITTVEIDELVAQTCAYMSTEHYDYGKLAGRMAVSNLHKETEDKFSEYVNVCYNNIDHLSGQRHPLYCEEVYKIVVLNADILNKAINKNMDYSYDYFAFKVLESSYLLRNGKHKIIERPQYMLMRTALGVHKDDIVSVLETYEYLSNGYFIHATPTLFNASTPKPQKSSCFLVDMESDSVEGIYNTLKKCALISKYAGGIGLSINRIRAAGSRIKGTNGISSGLPAMLPIFNDSSVYIDQGGQKRKGSIACYFEPWHADTFEVLELKKNTTDNIKKNVKDQVKTRDLFFGLWVPDLFVKRVIQDEEWSLFCPNDVPGLNDTWGDKFEELYIKYEKEGKARKKVKAIDLWLKIIETQIETGSPYMLFKDACNRKSNQQNLGLIRCSNLCTEIVEYTDEKEVAVCNLASIALPKCVAEGKFDFLLLQKITYIITLNLNKIIDNNFYPIPETEYSNKKNRPIGIGVQGLADVFILLKLPWDSEEARQLNREIFETIYFSALTASKDLAARLGPYESYEGSPISKGKFQFDLWAEEFESRKNLDIRTKEGVKVIFKDVIQFSGRYDWDLLRKEILKYGVRNSLTTAPMPTASTSQILGNNECIEPYTSNIYSRKVMAGDFIIVNKHLVNELTKLGLWSNELKNRIIEANGSVQNINEIPKEIKEIFKTSWELKMKILIDMALERGVFIDQSQSLNIFFEKPELQDMTNMFIYSWRMGLKTGMYYLRTRPSSDPVKFSIKKGKEEDNKEEEEVQSCPIGCDSCGA